MRLINLQNFRKDSSGISIGTNNEFTCYFNTALTIQPNSKVVLLHAEINNTVGAQNTALSTTGTVSQEQTTQPKDLVFINIPSLPVLTYTGQANGGKGRENHIIGAVRTNETDAVSSTFFEVDLHNKEPLTLTQLQVQILDTDYDLKTFGATTGYRQIITLGIKEGCSCK